jgi:hypothetical protein
MLYVQETIGEDTTTIRCTVLFGFDFKLLVIKELHNERVFA